MPEAKGSKSAAKTSPNRKPTNAELQQKVRELTQTIKDMQDGKTPAEPLNSSLLNNEVPDPTGSTEESKQPASKEVLGLLLQANVQAMEYCSLLDEELQQTKKVVIAHQRHNLKDQILGSFGMVCLGAALYLTICRLNGVEARHNRLVRKLFL